MKNNFKLSVPILTAVLIALALFVGGCGGSGSGTSSGTSLTSDKSAGQAKVTIKWPVRKAGRLVPVASNSIVISLTFNGSVVASQTAVSPGSGGSTNVFFPNLPVGQIGVTASAFPSTDGSGTAQATGSSTLTVAANTTATLTLTMGSTISSLKIGSTFTNPIAIMPATGSTQSLTVEALDANGDIVLVTPQTISWSSSNPTVLSVTADANDTGATIVGQASGNATVTVFESESGTSATLAVQVRGPLANLAITAITPQIFMGATMQFTIIATDAAGNTVSNPPGLVWSSSDAQVAQIAPSSGLCQAEVVPTVTTPQQTTITVAASGVPPATSVLTVLAGSGTGAFLSPNTVTLNGSTSQNYVIFTGTTQATNVLWSVPPITNAVGSLGTIDGNGLYTAPAQAPTVNGIPQPVTIQGISNGTTFAVKATIQ